MPRNLRTPLDALSYALDLLEGYQQAGAFQGAFYSAALRDLRQAEALFQADADAAAAAEEAPDIVPQPVPEPMPPPAPEPAPATLSPFHAGSEWPMARQQVSLVLGEARRLERYVARLDNPLLRGYAGVAVATLEHLSRFLEQSPNPSPLDPESVDQGGQP